MIIEFVKLFVYFIIKIQRQFQCFEYWTKRVNVWMIIVFALFITEHLALTTFIIILKYYRNFLILWYFLVSYFGHYSFLIYNLVVKIMLNLRDYFSIYTKMSWIFFISSIYYVLPWYKVKLLKNSSSTLLKSFSVCNNHNILL